MEWTSSVSPRLVVYFRDLINGDKMGLNVSKALATASSSIF